MATDVQAPRLLTVRDVAGRLQISEKSVRRRIGSSQLPAVQLGAPGMPLRINERDLDAYLERARVRPNEVA
jgi:excisionase family DNA binding protein